MTPMHKSKDYSTKKSQLSVDTTINSNKKISFEPLRIIAFILICFWLADTYVKVVVDDAPARVLWWSSAGLLLTVAGLYLKNTLILTGIACVLLLPESIWTLSFFSNLILKKDALLFTEYAFKPDYSPLKFIVTFYHLLAIPSLILGLYCIKKIHSRGWILAYVFSLVISYLAYIFPDQYSNVNCTQTETAGRCWLYFRYLYPLNDVIRIFLAATILTLFVYLPVNLVLTMIAKKSGWSTNSN